MTSVIPAASTATPNTEDQRPTAVALYRLLNAAGTLLYVGVTDNPDRRFAQHRDTKGWWPQVAKKTVDWYPSRDRALAEESATIAAEAPVYNIGHNPGAASYHWPPVGMPADRVEAIEREARSLPADQAEGIRRAAFEGFTRAQLDERTASTETSTRPDQRNSACLDLARVIEALPDAVTTAMQAVLPEHYTPELAAQIAQDAIAGLRRRALLTKEQTTLTFDQGMPAHRTLPIESELRDLDPSQHWNSGDNQPWLAAEVVVHDDKPQAYGRKTEVWLSYGLHTAELSPPQGREALKAMRGFGDRYEALLDFADQVAADDHDGDPEIARLDREAEDRRIARRTAELEAKADAALAEARA